ncbi:hypothetical protein, partial [Salmonella sp. SAL4454]|uniref:hypothetical protein n=1 Tax=Salmonella sp. SAL4454 TaxID=3159909 RepID=UPI003979D198
IKRLSGQNESKIEAAYYAYSARKCTEHPTMNCYQDEFDQTNGLRYLNHAAVAPWPRRAADAVSAFARENVAHGASDYPEWLKIEHR